MEIAIRRLVGDILPRDTYRELTMPGSTADESLGAGVTAIHDIRYVAFIAFVVLTDDTGGNASR